MSLTVDISAVVAGVGSSAPTDDVFDHVGVSAWKLGTPLYLSRVEMIAVLAAGSYATPEDMATLGEVREHLETAALLHGVAGVAAAVERLQLGTLPVDWVELCTSRVDALLLVWGAGR
ncbi:hypothetical protein [Frankia sp. BMG5.23]|uniref:hypothetical protein n=1 Tax=Frankia sp. BMG5.23 TaxID=683305 RepID=UPI000461036C|nr:hypothetical protein [Frankia sp. BMG5.23]KDA44231.1 hypothetical protein BMG523Draft_01031 [Frankia sp. BMG5.23]